MDSSFSDVIVAPASGAGSCAVAVIRLSGAGSVDLVSRLCRRSGHLAGPAPDRRMRLFWMDDTRTGAVLDQVMVAAYPEGASFTSEESVEIFCHGGPVIVDSIVRACIDLGARHAVPGEFTRRSVARGRLDLVQAEAIAMLSESENRTAAGIGLRALAGRPSAAVAGLSSRLLDVLADCEASLDFEASEEIYVDLSGIGPALQSAIAEMDSWMTAARAVRPAVTGFRVVISGPPNAGKSTLFNALSGADLAIVHDQPGTTRDVLSERIVLSGVGCVLFDTAGIREISDHVESEGVRRAVRAVASADLVLMVRDASAASGSADLPVDSKASGAVVFTKADLAPGFNPAFDKNIPYFVVSARTGEGMAGLMKFIASEAASAVASIPSVEAVVTGDRQISAVMSALGEAQSALDAIRQDAPLEAVSSHVRRSIEALGEVTGAHITDEVLDRIFSRFCIGK